MNTEEINNEKKKNDNNRKKEWENIFNDTIVIRSNNNGIDPIVNILIENIDKFSFAEGFEDEINDNNNIGNDPNNYLSVTYKHNNEKEIIEKIDDISINNEDNIIHNKINNALLLETIKMNNLFIINKLKKTYYKQYNYPLKDKNDLLSQEKNLKYFKSINDINKRILNYKEKYLLKNKEKNNIETNGRININDKKYNSNNINRISINSEGNNRNTMKKINGKNRNNSETNIISISDTSKKYFKKLLEKDTNEIKKEDEYIENNINNKNKYNTINNYEKNNEIKPLLPKKTEKYLSEINSISDKKKKMQDINNKITINPISFNKNKNKDIDVKTKLIELTEKIERSENNINIIKNSNEKLLEILNNFKIVGKEFNNYSNCDENYPNKIPLKRRCYSPSSNIINNKNKLKILNENNKSSIHRKSNSFSKLKIFIDSNKNNNNNIKNRYDKNKPYTPSKVYTYRQLYNRDKHNKKRAKSKIKVFKKNKSNKKPFIRKTIFLTGYSNETDGNIKNNNFITNTARLNEIESHNSFYNNYLNKYSFPTTRKNHNNSMILNSSEIGNIYQRQIMQLPPQNQPLFYESNNNCLSNILSDYNINIKNNNYADTFCVKEQKLDFDEKFNYSKNNKIPLNISDKNKNGNNYYSIYSNGNRKEIKKKQSREKIINNNSKKLDFKDFQVIFEEKEKSKITNQYHSYMINNNNSYRNKFIEKNIINNYNNNINNNNKFNNQNMTLKKKINILNNKKNIDNIKENGKVVKSDNIMKENGIQKEKKNISKYTDYVNKKTKTLLTKKIKNNHNDKNMNGIINKNKFTIPFYLINSNEFFLNILNFSSVKTNFK